MLQHLSCFTMFAKTNIPGLLRAAGETTSHSTRRANYAHQVAGYRNDTAADGHVPQRSKTI